MNFRNSVLSYCVMNEHSNSSLPAEIPTLSTSLMGRVQAMDPAGWNRLVLVFAPIVYRWCRRSGIRQADAPDIVQEVFTTLAHGIANFQRQREQGSFRAWLATITRSRVRDYLRKQRRQPLSVGGAMELEQLHSQPDELDSSINAESMESPLARRIMSIMQSEFEEVTWKAFCMTTLDNLSPAIVAERLQISLASVYQARTRVLRKLRQRLADLSDS